MSGAWILLNITDRPTCGVSHKHRSFMSSINRILFQNNESTHIKPVCNSTSECFEQYVAILASLSAV